MKALRRIGATALILALLGGLAACGGTPSETTQPQPTETTEATPDPVLTERREKALAYMYDMATFLWRAGEDIYYTKDSEVLTEEQLAEYDEEKVIKIKAGRLYRGVPYSYSGASAWNFYDFASEPDEKGIATVSGVNWRSLNGGSRIGACLGNDCSGAVQLAWNSVGSSNQLASTQYMTLSRGYLPVGEYENDPNENIITKDVCVANGGEVMFAAYAQLQKADAVVNRGASAGHTMMISDVVVVYKADGSIDPINSYVTVVHQTSSYIFDEACAYDETLGEDVYQTFGIDDKKDFLELFGAGYLPVTCTALVNPDAVEEAYVTDSEVSFHYDNILGGTFTSNRIIGAVTVSITDQAGNVVLACTCYGSRQTSKPVFTFDMTRFITGEECTRRGELALDELAPGTYHCTHTLRDGHGTEYVMRDFDFMVE